MDVLHLIVGGSRDDGTRINGFLALLPMLPQTRKTKNLLIGPGNMIGLLSALFYYRPPLSYVDMSRFLLTEQFLYIWNRPIPVIEKLVIYLPCLIDIFPKYRHSAS